MTGERWWHAYGAEVDGVWIMLTLGGSNRHPEPQFAAAPTLSLKAGGFVPAAAELVYLRSWNHEPSDDEQTAITPHEYQT